MPDCAVQKPLMDGRSELVMPLFLRSTEKQAWFELNSSTLQCIAIETIKKLVLEAAL